jgi:transcriptional regulator GlxA family with amidase domain
MPSMGELADGVGISERHARRAIDSLQREYAMPLDGWRETIADMRLSAAQQLLSIPGMRGSRVATLSGFRSAVALSHAFTRRSAGTPGEMARALGQRWG